jgi:hypothetical protein
MNYASALIGFVLATLITVGARAEAPPQLGYPVPASTQG